MSRRYDRRPQAVGRPRPGAGDVRRLIGEESRKRSALVGLSLFFGYFSLYFATLLAIVAAPWWPVKFLCAAVNGLLIFILLCVGHDACHGSLTPSKALNVFLGRLAFLPSLTPYSTWEAGHNRLHHAFPNLKGVDPAWAPLSKEEYDCSPPYRRALERLYRTIPGVGLNYFIEVWWKVLICPRRRVRTRVRSRLLLCVELASAVGFTGVGVAGLFAWQKFLGGALSLPEMPLPLLAAEALLCPWLVFNWIIGFVSFLQHTHPKVKWYVDREEWSFYGGQIQASVHTVFPWPVELLMHPVMEHTAHHTDPRVPAYNLAVCQKRLEEACPDVIVQRFTWGSFRNILSTCQLYDYANHRWLDFDGNPAAPPSSPHHI